MSDDQWVPPFVCPLCQRPSWHPKDAEERFCAACGFVDDVMQQSTGVEPKEGADG